MALFLFFIDMIWPLAKFVNTFRGFTIGGISFKISSVGKQNLRDLQLPMLLHFAYLSPQVAYIFTGIFFDP